MVLAIFHPGYVLLYKSQKRETIPAEFKGISWFYLKYSIVHTNKFPPNIYDVNSSIQGLSCCLCESVISMTPLKRL